MNADNTIILNGRLTRDVELSHMQDGKAVAKFTVAVNRAYKDANGDRQADFHNCVIFGNRAEAVANYFHKGDMIGVAGELRDNNYEKDGVQHYNKQIVVDSFGFRGQNSQNNNASGTQNNSVGVDTTNKHKTPHRGSMEQIMLVSLVGLRINKITST